MKKEDKHIRNLTINTDLLQIAIDSSALYESLIPKDLTSSLQEMMKKVNLSLAPLQSITIPQSEQLIKLSNHFQQIHKSQIDTFQNISKILEPLISAQTKLSEQLDISINNPTIDALKNLYSFSAYSIFDKLKGEFDQTYDFDNISKEQIEQTIEENKELISEVNEVVRNAEFDGFSPGDTTVLIYEFLLKKVPTLNRKTYTVIVLIILTSITFYSLYSDYSTDEAISNNIIPNLNEITKTQDSFIEDLDIVKKQNVDQLEKLETANLKIDSLNETIENSIKEKANFEKSLNYKLDRIIEEMKSKN